MENNGPDLIAIKRIGEVRRIGWTELGLGNLELTELPKEICDLVVLRRLYLSPNKLTSLPSGIGNLINLNELVVRDNKLASLPSEIGQLANLWSLEIRENQLTELPSEIGKLENLEKLDVSCNKLFSIPAEIGKLKNLKRLIANNLAWEGSSEERNNLTFLPPEIRQLEKLEELDLRGNPLPIPPEILEKYDEPQTILNYYFSIFKINVSDAININTIEMEVVGLHVGKRLNETKLLVVGQGSVGKTSLIQQILHGKFDKNQIKTAGISINQWAVNTSQSEIINPKFEIRLNIWDFGGQEIMHATHQFFLTKRSLYLLVLDARLTQEENRVEYWLKIIQSFGGESPVLLIGNKIDQHPLDIDRTGLQKKYPNIIGILETSAATGAGIKALKAEITRQVDILPHVRDLLPETWFTVKSKLEELSKDKNFIAEDEYLDLCATNEVTDETSQHTLIGFLHDLGVVLHFQDDPRLEALGILNPQWVTNGVYKILNWYNVFQNQGVLTLSILNDALSIPEYPKDKRLFIVDMMKKFELCYDIEPDKSFLIPDLLPKDEPFAGDWDGALPFQYHYNVLPSSIITRFIVRMNAFVHKTVWRSGVMLKSGGNTALVKADTEDRKIFIWVTGDENTRRDFLSAIRMEFDAIHKTIAKIEATEKVPHPSYPELVLDYSELIEFERQGINEFPKKVESQVVMCNVRELLDGVRPSKNQATKVFISYGHDDKKFVQKMAGELAKDNFESWWDFDALKGGHDWQKEIQQGIKRCDFFLVVLTPQSVESEWVNKEITYANEYKKKIIPIRLKECERPISIIEKQYIDFEKQTQKAALKQLLGLLKDRI